MTKQALILAMHEALDERTELPAEVQSHIARDPELAEHWQSLRMADEQCRRAMHSDAAPSARVDRIMDAVAREPAGRRASSRGPARRWRHVAMALAGGGIAAAILLGLPTTPEPAGEVTPAVAPDLSLPRITFSMEAQRATLAERGDSLARAAEHLLESPLRLLPPIPAALTEELAGEAPPPRG